MAMVVQQAFVAEFFASSLTFGRHVVDFNDLNVLKEQPTPATFPLLFVQEDSFDPIAQRVVFQSLAPIEEITIVGTGCALHFDVLLDVGLTVFPQRGFLATELPALSLLHMPVFVRNPVPSFFPLAQIEEECGSAHCLSQRESPFLNIRSSCLQCTALAHVCQRFWKVVIVRCLGR